MASRSQLQMRLVEAEEHSAEAIERLRAGRDLRQRDVDKASLLWMRAVAYGIAALLVAGRADEPVASPTPEPEEKPAPMRRRRRKAS